MKRRKTWPNKSGWYWYFNDYYFPKWTPARVVVRKENGFEYVYFSHWRNPIILKSIRETCPENWGSRIK